MDTNRLKDRIRWNSDEKDARARDLREEETLLRRTTERVTVLKRDLAREEDIERRTKQKVLDLKRTIDTTERALASTTRDLERAEAEAARAKQAMKRGR